HVAGTASDNRQFIVLDGDLKSFLVHAGHVDLDEVFSARGRNICRRRDEAAFALEVLRRAILIFSNRIHRHQESWAAMCRVSYQAFTSICLGLDSSAFARVTERIPSL